MARSQAKKIQIPAHKSRSKAVSSGSYFPSCISQITRKNIRVHTYGRLLVFHDLIVFQIQEEANFSGMGLPCRFLVSKYGRRSSDICFPDFLKTAQHPFVFHLRGSPDSNVQHPLRHPHTRPAFALPSIASEISSALFGDILAATCVNCTVYAYNDSTQRLQ